MSMPKEKSLPVLIIRVYLQNRGFTLPLALGIGLMILLMGVMMMVRSQSDSTMANAQKNADKAISAAEIAATRYQQLLGKYPVLAAFPYCSNDVGASAACPDTYDENVPISQASWNNIGPLIKPPPGQNVGLLQRSSVASCPDPTTIRNEVAAFTTTAWQEINPGNPRAGQFRLVNFTFTPAADADASKQLTSPVRIGNGILTVEGKVNLTTGNADDVSTAKTQIQVQVPVTRIGAFGAYPGVWTKTGGVGNNAFQANVLLGDCGQSTSGVNVTGTDPVTGQPYRAYQSNAQMPEVPPLCQGTAFNPAVDSSLTCRPTSFSSSNNLGNVSANLTLPRPIDSFEGLSVPRLDANGQQVYVNGQPVSDSYRVYKYRVGDVSLTGLNQWVINTGAFNIATNTVDSTQTPIKVYLYVDGNISIDSSAALTHSCSASDPKCTATDLHLYGYNGNGAGSPEFCMNGNGVIEAFILAPAYRVGVAGSGGGPGGVKGNVWAKSWSNGDGGCGSDSSNVVVEQQGNWTELSPYINLTSARSSAAIKPLASWTRREYGTN